MITHMSENNGSGGKRLLGSGTAGWSPGCAPGLPRTSEGRRELVRLGFGVFTVFYGLGILIYLIAWAVLPEEGADNSILESFVHRL